MQIGALAQRAGVRTSAIRYYEAEGLLPAPARVGGRREYDPSALLRLRLIRVAQYAGFTLSETRTIVRGVGAERPLSAAWRRLAEGKLVELAGTIGRLEAMRQFLDASLRCACVRVEDCELLAEASAGEPPQGRRLALLVRSVRHRTT
jgi:MerR family transcriptional regulator, redox-sensitive transcriptional activator SoxR